MVVVLCYGTCSRAEVVLGEIVGRFRIGAAGSAGLWVKRAGASVRAKWILEEILR